MLFTAYVPSPADARSPEAQTVGTGEAWVFTKGKVVGGTWRRDAADQQLQLTDAARAPPIELTPGQTWIELPDPGGADLLTLIPKAEHRIRSAGPSAGPAGRRRGLLD